MSSTYIGSKWKKTYPLLADAQTRRWVPETAKLTKEKLRALLSRYDSVYVKPVYGMHGNGVMRVRRLPAGALELSMNTSKLRFATLNDLYGALLRAKKGKSYLAQRGIHLLKHKGRRFDIRVMVQTNLSKQWEATGVIGRLAAPGRVVTNYHSGGTPMSLERLLGSHLSGPEIQRQIRSLKSKGVRIAKVLKRKYPGIREIGVDIGMDRDYRPWVIEVNTMPDPYIFRKLPDKSVVRKVLRYARAYGRIR